MPARISVNLTLYTYLGALEARGLASPCGFLHLPYLPEQVVWMMRRRAGRGDSAPTTPPRSRQHGFRHATRRRAGLPGRGGAPGARHRDGGGTGEDR